MLSPLYWNLIFDALLKQLNRGAITCIGFADDGLLLIQGSNPDVLRVAMQDAIELAEVWGSKFGLEFCPKKTAAMLFHKSKRISVSVLLLSDQVRQHIYFQEIWLVGPL